MKEEILYGVHPVEEALRADRRRFSAVFLSAGSSSKRLQVVENRAAARNIPVQRIPISRLNQLACDAPHQGVAARVGPLPLATLTNLHSIVEPAGLVILLDGVVDPRNLGAIIRTALGVGAGAVILPKNRAAGPTPAVSKASAGALEHIRLVEVVNLAAAIKTLKSVGWWAYGMVQAAGDSLYGTDLTGLVAMVIGGEAKGLRPLVRQQCDFLLSIPQQGPVSSLNASVAAAVAMYEVYRQRHHTHRPGPSHSLQV